MPRSQRAPFCTHHLYGPICHRLTLDQNRIAREIFRAAVAMGGCRVEILSIFDANQIRNLVVNQGLALNRVNVPE